MQKIELIAIVGCGGFIGAALRYIISLNAAKIFGADFPYGTLIANIIGAIIIGFVMKMSLDTSLITPNTKLFLTTGMMGGLTTFSTFSYETVTMINSGQYVLGALNLGLNVVLSFIGVTLGMIVARLVI
ncbi:MAG: fluoride efflux transporter CrcB [Clostridium baratii]|uniref:Fluoride-specific ion channel FluC n=1 Tax=Clostridium baratii str. Sullivan TaxID=1415775 RepID=A0A0A7FTZ4_9CLOT|nr:fluoride efflux transporter CrcB [Clostridium baratii]AIY83104.1 crcB-like family protein [Clostridium baratii str. Sullivan]MBS6008071.1 fluoride efflux transporter CrcB [Clostridium baratii]MDU1055034.1 fluoride efflux transporter CrcB [Clostridium baratii]MDU4912233.1 fluoride efflux transporter CrcB [Clostridium baratii]CUP78262.1 camphor resistance protein CrcB [Clostridium baratii]